MAVTKHAFSSDQKYSLYKLTNAKGTELQVATFGARLVRFIVKDKTGAPRDVVAGFESYEKWIESLSIDDPYFGATVGRVAGRIYPCDDVTVADQKLSLPEIQPNKVCLHGGKIGFDKKLFSAEVLSESSPASVKFTYVSPDGEEGFPGEVELSVTYSLSDDNAMTLSYGGKLLNGTETILNPTNHTYWNLTGFEEPTVHNHMCSLTADRYMATRPDHIMVPTGECALVKGTNLDFVTAPRRFGDDIETFDKDTLRGYDHIFVASDKPTENVREVARLWSPKSGLQMTVLTDQPCVVVYTGNWISDKLVGKDGVRYGNYAAVAFETQRFTNAVNLPQFRDQVLLHPGDNLTHTTTYKFDLLA
ncbi:Converts alpha-aldose to the beta-anomer [Linderina macrospora]|uniref:Converts alpha-aldose to the beta-anomer n=1 Tax=Linderina macrospora TaxID=4868 RepID=A0ACC1J8W0_9FUNG|nr:Converts alpha-aldose to the beta-anomer [Linderina macrospora]